MLQDALFFLVKFEDALLFDMNLPCARLINSWRWLQHSLVASLTEQFRLTR